MKLTRQGISVIALGTVLLGTGASGVMAQSARVMGDVQQYNGPGTNYEATEILPAGTTVGDVNCQGAWCLVTYNGRQGWVAASFLEQQQAAPADEVPLWQKLEYNADGSYDGPNG